VLDLPGAVLRESGSAVAASEVLARVARADLEGFWIHVDADVIDPRLMPAVDSPTPGGPSLDELAEFLAPLTHHPRALGMELTIYDPRLDSDGACARRLVDLLVNVLT
jgi:arginase